MEQARAAGERRRANLARALAAFPGHWTADQIVEKRHWRHRQWVDPLNPPHVIVRCEPDDNVELFKATRVREYEMHRPNIKEARNEMARDIRCERRQERERRQVEDEREAYLRERLAAQISVNVHDLPPLVRP
jgi:hypothetical protein